MASADERRERGTVGQLRILVESVRRRLSRPLFLVSIRSFVLVLSSRHHYHCALLEDRVAQPTYKINYSADVSAGCRELLDRIGEFIDTSGHIRTAFPTGGVKGTADASALFERIALHFRFTTEGEEPLRGALIWAADFLSRAVQRGCITTEDIDFLVSIPIQFPLIFRDFFGARLCDGTPSDIGQHAAIAAVYVDLLLFISELHEPRVDRLRKKRVRLDVDAMSWARGAKLGEGTPSPEPLIATLGWEKLLRDNHEFQEDTRTVIAWMQGQFGKVAPYWTFTLATSIHDAPFLFAAFDAKFRYNSQSTRSVSKSLASRKTRYYVGASTAGSVLRETENFLLFFCRKYNIETMGTPFLTPPLCDELHILAQQVVVTHRHNAVEVVIPAFYTGNHLEKYLDRDFYDLDRAISHKLSVQPVRSVKKPDPNACPLNERELAEAAKVVRKVLEQTHGLSPYRSYRYAERAMSWWWPWRSEVKFKKGKENKRTLKRLEGPTSEDASTRMTRWIRPPVPSKADMQKDMTLKYPSRERIVQMVNDSTEDGVMTAHELYAWAKYYRELLKRRFVAP